MSSIVTTGAEFEEYLRKLFVALGYRQVTATPASGDFGADLIMVDAKTGRKIAVQAKFYTGNAPLGNTPVQEVVASLSHYGAQDGWVVTNNRFSQPARELAKDNGVRLIDGAELKVLENAARRPIPATPQEAWSGVSDTSGIDVLVGGGRAAANNPTRTQAYPQASNAACQPAATKATPKPATSANSNLYFSLSDVKIRWNCSEKYVKDQISRGMPMYKVPNGRWEIATEDLLRWEEMLNKEASKRRAMAKAGSAVQIVVIILLLAALIVAVVVGYGMIAPKYGLPPLAELPDFTMAQMQHA